MSDLESKIKETLNTPSIDQHIALLMESSRGRGFDLLASVNAILAKARHRKYMAYSELPDPSERTWPERRHPTRWHLRDIVFYCHAKGLPIVSSIVVDAKSRDSGEMNSSSLSGFIAASKLAGYAVDQPEDFYRSEQERTFRYARGLLDDFPDGLVNSNLDLQKLLVKEGELISRVVDLRSRSSSVRDHCLETYGAVCQVCQKDFGKRYGDDFQGLIEVHHKNPMAACDGTRETNPSIDCYPLCPNCHRMAHYGKPAGECRSIEELRAIVMPQTEN